jgi:hypothetical protein
MIPVVVRTEHWEWSSNLAMHTVIGWQLYRGCACHKMRSVNHGGGGGGWLVSYSFHCTDTPSSLYFFPLSSFIHFLSRGLPSPFAFSVKNKCTCKYFRLIRKTSHFWLFSRRKHNSVYLVYLFRKGSVMS